MRKLLLFLSAIVVSMMISAQDRPDPQPAADTYEKFKVGMAGYTFVNFDLDKTLQTLEKCDVHYLCIKDFHLPFNSTDQQIADFHEKLKSKGVTGYAVGPIYMKTEQEIDNAFEYAKRVGVKLIVGVPNYDLLPYLDKKVKEYDFNYAIHLHGPDMPLYPDADDVWENVKDLDPRIGMCLDIGHDRRNGKVLCGGNPQTLQFAKDVVNELMDIFPDAPYIHIGGDECPKAEWMKCPKCQAKIKELGLHDTEEHSKENQLQVYFMNEVEKEIAKRGKKMLAWDEILEGNPNPETTTVMAWTGIKASVKAAQLGHSTIVCPISHLYFSNPGYNRLKGISSVERVYMFEPQSEKLTPEEKKNIIGVQGCIWTEWTKDSVKMEWQMMPRIAALSELQWCNPERKDLNGFLKRLRHQMDLYELYGYHYKEDIEDVTISVKPKGQDGIAVVELNTFDNASVYYTLDGSEPTSESLRYTEPFMINRTTTIKARAIRNGRESNVTEETLTYNLATMHSITPVRSY